MSGSAPILFSALDLTEGASLGKSLSSLVSDFMLVIGVGFVLLGIFVVWAVYMRKPKRKRKPRDGGRKVYRETPASGEDGESRKRYKFRYHRRSHRGRNPSLAETGGLPPGNAGENQDEAIS